MNRIRPTIYIGGIIAALVIFVIFDIILFSRNETVNEQTSQLTANNDESGQSLRLPIDRALERMTKKPFGIYITPQNSPVESERFSGFHTGTDFEIFPGEETKDILIRAICGGDLIFKNFVLGYGGVAIQACRIDNQKITILYGHLRLASISPKTGDFLTPGDLIGVLGTGFSAETDRERKHLHLAIHKGVEINLRGYVPDQQLLSAWLDPVSFFNP